MRCPFIILFVCVTVLGPAAGTPAQHEPARPKIENARPYIEQICTHLSSTNPRVRFTAREALRNYGSQAVPLIRAARERTRNPHVKAFIDRTLGRVRILGRLASRKGNAAARKKTVAALRNRPPYDIDRIAVHITLTFEQISKLDPILRRHFKELRKLWGELREAGALKDKEAYQDLNQEIKLMVEKAVPKLQAFLDARQIEYVKRIMLQLRSGGKYEAGLPVHLQAWQRELEERWKNRENLSEAELEALKAEWGEFKRQAYEGRGGK